MAGLGSRLRKQTNYQRFAFLLLVITVIPLFFNLPIPVPTRSYEYDFLNQIKALNKGDVVVMAGEETTMGSGLIMRDIYRAVIWSLCDQGAKIIFLSFADAQVAIWQNAVTYADIAGRYSYVEGVNYVIFPYIGGLESGMAAIAANMHLMASDIYGTAIQNLPIMNNVNTIHDVKLTCVYCSSNTNLDLFVRQWPVKYGVHMVTLMVWTVVAPYYGIYIQGYLESSSYKGYASFEFITGYYGIEIKRVQMTNMIVIVSAIALVGLNVIYWVGKARSRPKVSAEAGPTEASSEGGVKQ